jgi:hypothetical protein
MMTGGMKRRENGREKGDVKSMYPAPLREPLAITGVFVTNDLMRSVR